MSEAKDDDDAGDSSGHYGTGGGRGRGRRECKEGSGELFAVGAAVERDIDGTWYPAQVLAVHEDVCPATYDIEYLDDGNTEHDVPARDIRRLDDAAVRAFAEQHGDRRPQQQQPPVATPSALLAGAADEPLNSGGGDVAPTVTYHAASVAHDNGEDGRAGGAYIINGPDTNIAAGSGLRALRWLRG